MGQEVVDTAGGGDAGKDRQGLVTLGALAELRGVVGEVGSGVCLLLTNPQPQKIAVGSASTSEMSAARSAVGPVS